MRLNRKKPQPGSLAKNVCEHRAYFFFFAFGCQHLGIATASPLLELTTSTNKNVLRGYL